jgi:hypothetical protein
LEKWSKGTYNFRLSFYGVNQDFEYIFNSDYVSDASELENPSTLPPFKITITPVTESVSLTVSNNNVQIEEQYLSRN